MSTPVSYCLQSGPNTGSGRLASFAAPSDAAAKVIAQSYSTLFNATACLLRNDSGATLATLSPAAGVSSVAAWVASGVRALKDLIVPTSGNAAAGYLFQCTTAGTSSASQPTWNTTIGGTTTDGGAIWTCIGLTSSGTGSALSPY